ncbi:hypothetical protein DSO57_1002157 [Entomophthora muscae]|uniref:Uncharacterized protein n=1 Tax=Entomophthora muscae TaxID=34485 RepID=A0ACC2SLT4_9FUNG|nr:hypothetical protein DSO57_1002157 [Entomophthora muscae]
MFIHICIGIPHLVFQEIKVHALNFALKANLRVSAVSSWILSPGAKNNKEGQRQAISACLFKTSIKSKDDPLKQTKAVKKYTGICKMILAYYLKDRKLEHLQAISVALPTNV